MLLPHRKIPAFLARGVQVGFALVLLTIYWSLVRLRPNAVTRRARPWKARRQSCQSCPESLIRVITSSVDRAAELQPLRVGCLEKALTTRRLLTWCGEPASVALGIRRDGDALDAHAWVEVGDHSVDASRPQFRSFAQLR